MKKGAVGKWHSLTIYGCDFLYIQYILWECSYFPTVSFAPEVKGPQTVIFCPYHGSHFFIDDAGEFSVDDAVYISLDMSVYTDLFLRHKGLY